jgi:hypothetical protein
VERGILHGILVKFHILNQFLQRQASELFDSINNVHAVKLLP